MRKIATWNDFHEYGIATILHEGPTLGVRCDVTHKAKTLLEQFLRVDGLILGKRARRGPDGDPYVGSIVLPAGIRMQLAVFVLLSDGCTEVFVHWSDVVTGADPGDTEDEISRYHNFHGGRKIVGKFRPKKVIVRS